MRAKTLYDLLKKTDRVAVSNITGREASKVSMDSQAYCNNIVGGWALGKGGQKIACGKGDDIPVFANCADLMKGLPPEKHPNKIVVYSPPQAVYGDVVCDFSDMYDVAAKYFECPAGKAIEGIGCISADPLYIDPNNEEYDISDTSPAKWGDPSFVDWDDAGSPSNDPGNYDTDTRSRMGCQGGPGGEVVGLLT